MEQDLNIRSLIERSGKVAASVSVIMGFIGDVLSPLGPYSFYFFLLSLVLVLGSGSVWHFKIRKQFRLAMSDGKITSAEYVKAFERNPWLTVFSFSAVAAPILLILSLVNATAPETGILADNIPALASLQQQLFHIQADVSEIKISTQEITQNTDKILSKVEEISKSFESLKDSGSLVDSPTTPQDFYHNAKIHELDGNYALARKAYQDYLAFNLDFIDPHLSYQMMLKAQEGRESARDTYQYLLARHSDGVALRFATTLLLDKEPRINALKLLIQDQPDFAPAYYQLSLEYSEEKLGMQTSDDKKSEKTYLAKFTELDQQGQFIKYFLDKSLTEEWQKDAQTRAKKLEFISDKVLAAPVTLTSFSTGAGLMIVFAVADKGIKEIFYRFDSDPDFKSLGFQNFQSPTTGLPMPQMTLSNVKLPPGEYKIQVQYKDLNDEMKGPYDLTFSTQGEVLKTGKMILSMIPWVQFKNDSKGLKIYFTPLLSNSNILKEIRYGLDKPEPDRKFAFTPWAEPGPPKIPSENYIEDPVQQSISVQVVFSDGSVSEVKNFAKP